MVTMTSFKQKYGIHFTTRHNGKMEEMTSLSTSVIKNPYCQARQRIAGSICEKCYSEAMHNMYSDLSRCTARNTEVLTSIIIPVNEWPVVNRSVFRLEAFGDLNNVIQVINYFNFCLNNPRTTFSLWTKNPWIIKEAIAAGHKKPRNLIIILSSIFLNKPADKKMLSRYPFVDKVFTVYNNGEPSNCAGLNCNACRRCYSKRTTKEIKEHLHK